MKFTKDAVEKVMDAVDLGFVEKEDGETYMTAKLDEESLKLEPSDLADCVVLSVDEAKKIRDLIWKLQSLETVTDSMESSDWFVYWALNGKIANATTESK